MEDGINKKNSQNPLSLEGEQVKYRPKNLSEPLQGQEVLRDILSSESSTKQPTEEEYPPPIPLSDIPFESLSSKASEQTTDFGTKKEAYVPSQPSSSESLERNENSPLNNKEEGQIKYNKTELPSSPETSIESAQEKVFSTQQPAYKQSEATTSIFRLKKGTRRAFVVLKDIFGDEEVSLGNKEEERKTSPKKKMAVLFFASFFGILGVHRLYLGHYHKFFRYPLLLAFYWVSKSLLPDRGLGNLLLIFLGLWILADILAIIFSHRILDKNGAVLRNWF